MINRLKFLFSTLILPRLFVVEAPMQKQFTKVLGKMISNLLIFIF